MAALLQITDFQSLSLGKVLPHTTWVRGGTPRTLPGTREVPDLVNGQMLSSVASLDPLPQDFPTVTGQLGLESHGRLRSHSSSSSRESPLGPVALHLERTVVPWGVSTHALAVLGQRQSMGHASLDNFFGSLGLLGIRASSVSPLRIRWTVCMAACEQTLFWSWLSSWNAELFCLFNQFLFSRLCFEFLFIFVWVFENRVSLQPRLALNS